MITQHIHKICFCSNLYCFPSGISIAEQVGNALIQNESCDAKNHHRKKRLWYRCFPMNFAKFLRTPFFVEQLWWLILDLITRACRIGTMVLMQCSYSSLLANVLLNIPILVELIYILTAFYHQTISLVLDTHSVIDAFEYTQIGLN